MKKGKNILVLCLTVCLLSSQSILVISQQKDNHNQSKQLIERYNKIRLKNNLPLIYHDTVLDNVVSNIFLNRKYKNSNNSYNEDSIRLLLYKDGIIDYQYEIKEISDKDTLATFNSFLLSDNTTNIHVGYKEKGNRHILFKTKNYLKFDHWKIFIHSDHIDALHSKVAKVAVKTDSVIGYFKTSNPGKYYYQFYDRIPLITNKLDNIKKFEVHTVKTDNKSTNQDMYDLIIKSTNSDGFLIISNMNNEKIVIIK